MAQSCLVRETGSGRSSPNLSVGSAGASTLKPAGWGEGVLNLAKWVPLVDGPIGATIDGVS